MRQEIEKALNQLRPSLQEEGNVVELLSVTKFGMVEVKISGECNSCNSQRILAMLDFEKCLKELVPEVKFVTIGVM